MAEKEDLESSGGIENPTKKEKKKKMKKKRSKQTDGDDGDGQEPTKVAADTESSDKAQVDKVSKKGKDRKRTRGDADDDREKPAANADDKVGRRLARKKDRASRSKAKEELMDKVPKVDENGIAYTKLQTKRMLKRVKKGLPPVPTAKEEQQRLRNEAQLRREEEAELAGLVYRREEEAEEATQEDMVTESADGEDGTAEAVEDSGVEEAKEDETGPATEGSEGKPPRMKKSKRSKEVPSDYVCQACKNKHQPAHWIYDCPDKVTVHGTNKKKKKLRGLHDPDSRKVFVSGLPFEVKVTDVEQLFQGCGKVASCKLIKFGDTGRCNGQAYVSFDTDEGAKKALGLSGTTIDNTAEDSKKKKKDKATEKRRELKLKVSKVLNRRMSKKGSK